MSASAQTTTSETESSSTASISSAGLSVATESSSFQVRYPTDIPCDELIERVRLNEFYDATISGVLKTNESSITVIPELRKHVENQLSHTFPYWRHLPQRKRDQVSNSEALWSVIKKLHDDAELNHAVVFTTLAGVGIANNEVKKHLVTKRRSNAELQNVIRQTKAPLDVLAKGEPISFVPAFLYNPGKLILGGPSWTPSRSTTAPLTATTNATPLIVTPRPPPQATGWLKAPARKAPTLSLRETSSEVEVLAVDERTE